ncbi:MAG: hypothetical protein EAZ89_20055 [Bacteroidetes bacterium]|nr:MAG: hypothetical protein EAZ89_20055 [Bacteroidota bacterium]
MLSSPFLPSRFSPELPYELSELRVVVEYPASETNDSLCKGWNLSESQVRELLGAAQPITAQEQHYAFDHLPCKVEGRLSQKGQTYTLTCNGGAWLSISHQDTTLLFGHFGKTLDAYFISPPYADE